MFKKIPAKYLQMTFLGFFMASAISFVKVISYESSTLFDILTIPLVIGILGGLAGCLIALLVWVYFVSSTLN